MHSGVMGYVCHSATVKALRLTRLGPIRVNMNYTAYKRYITYMDDITRRDSGLLDKPPANCLNVTFRLRSPASLSYAMRQQSMSSWCWLYAQTRPRFSSHFSPAASQNIRKSFRSRWTPSNEWSISKQLTMYVLMDLRDVPGWQDLAYGIYIYTLIGDSLWFNFNIFTRIFASGGGVPPNFSNIYHIADEKIVTSCCQTNK